MIWEYRLEAPLSYRKLSPARKTKSRKQAIEVIRARRVGEREPARIEVEYDSQEGMFIVRGFST